jgi:hypothetical protein
MSKLSRFAPLLAVVALAGCGSHSAPGRSPSFGVPPKGFHATVAAPQPTVEMFDSVTVGTVPSNPRVVAGYIAGNWPTYGPLVRAFPRAIHVPVAIQGDESITGVRMACLDSEPGDAPAGAVGDWDRREIEHGVKPCDYGSLSNMPAIEASIRAAGVKRSQVFLFDADWTDTRHLDAGYDATQWTDHALGRNLDESTVTYAFAGIALPHPLPLCFTHRITRAQCSAIKKTVASDQRASASSQRAYVARGCPTLEHRIVWFGTQLSKHPKVKTASRKRALSASHTAYRQRSCGVFVERETYFSIAAEEAKSHG